MMKKLVRGDIDSILEVEKRAFIPPLQAKPDMVLKRFDLGHQMLGAEINRNLVGTVAFRYGNFSEGLDSFPDSFEKYVNRRSEIGNAVFGYSFGFIPEFRSSTLPHHLLSHLIKDTKERGFEFIVGIGRCPSYNGSNFYEQEEISQKLSVKEEIDRCISEKRLPCKKILEEDPIMKFYINLFNPEMLGVLPKFFRGDHPSGEHLIAFYRNLK